MNGWGKTLLRFVVVTTGIVGLTSLGIDASDMLGGSQSALGILADRATQSECSKGMVKIESATGSFCIDEYENGVGEGCPMPIPGSANESAANVNALRCESVSEEGIEPWTNVAIHQARTLCAKAGKRLPNATEWYIASLGTSDGSHCNTDGNKAMAGAFPECVSGSGVYDMIGNVWELVDGDVNELRYSDRELPQKGYVSLVDDAGLAQTTTSTPQTLYNDDYFWSEAEGVYVMMRGGFYGSREDAGIYAVHAAIRPDFSSGAIGFRCVQSL